METSNNNPTTDKAAVRIQTSILNGLEKKVLVWLAKRQPKWVTSDFLTYVGLLGAILCALGFILSSFSPLYLWISSLGLVINWYGDSLDGTLARVRGTQRPIYGFFIDHTVDGLTISLMCIGAGLSPYFSLDVGLLVLVGYLLMSLYTYINTHLRNEFCLTYGKLGPTEFRLIIIILNTFLIYLPTPSFKFVLGGKVFGLFDLIGLIIAAILFVIYIISFEIDRRKYAKIDPLKKQC